ncbi:MAG: alpha/beta hydrolase [Solirubrobacterales bacterium]
MPEIERPDGIRIHWQEVGSGPTVVMSLQFFALPKVFQGLIDHLSSDFRIVTYDLRGSGGSSHAGPYEMEVDVGDLIAVIEAAGAPAVLVGAGDGTNRAVWVASKRPDLATAVVSPGGNPVGREAARDTDAMVASQSVLDALRGMMATDYRGALRSLLTSANPQMSEEEIRDRVQATAEYCPPEAADARLRGWMADRAADAAQSLGDRLWILDSGNNVWFTAGVIEGTRKLLPDAHVEHVEDGPLSRPDIAAGYVRRAAQLGARPAPTDSARSSSRS